MAELCLWTKIRTKKWLVLGTAAFQCMHADFLCSKCDNFACLHTRQDQNEFHLEKWFFCANISIFCKSIAGPLSEAYTSVYTTIFVRRRYKTNYLPNQTWAKCYLSRNKHYWKKKQTLDGGANNSPLTAMAQLCLWTKIGTKQWLVLGASALQCMRAGFLCSKCDNFGCLRTRQDQNELHLKRWLFVVPISASSVSRSQAHLAKRNGIAWSIGFNSWTNWTLYGVIPRSLYKIRFNGVSEKFNCWERRWIDVDGTSHILSVTAVMFSLSQFLSRFSQDNEHMELTELHFSQNPYTIFAHILQHYHDFRSNVAIFPKVVQAYTQPYSFGGRIKLIPCQIRHELSVTTHEISSSWKKNVRWRT